MCFEYVVFCLGIGLSVFCVVYMLIIVGLGNPGPEYENTRHNAGRLTLEAFRKEQGFPEWRFDRKLNALMSPGKVSSLIPPSSSPLQRKGKRGVVQKVALILPETFMNKSGDAVQLIKDLRFQVYGKKKEVPNLAVIHDDLDIPFGSYKISFDKSSGGHKGVESVIRALGTQAFVRGRVGIVPTTPAGKLKKPKGDAAVEKHILGRFSPEELPALKKTIKRISDALVCLVTEGKEKAMSQFN